MTGNLSGGGKPSRKLLLGAGAFLAFVIMVGADIYLDTPPTFKDIVGYALLSVLLSPLGAVAIALQGGWTEQQRRNAPVPKVVVVLVMLAMLAVVIVAAAGY